MLYLFTCGVEDVDLNHLTGVIYLHNTQADQYLGFMANPCVENMVNRGEIRE